MARSDKPNKSKSTSDGCDKHPAFGVDILSSPSDTARGSQTDERLQGHGRLANTIGSPIRDARGGDSSSPWAEQIRLSVTDLRDAKAAILAERAFHIIGTIAEAGFKKWTVVSGSRPGKRHKVEHNEHGWTCGCEDFKKHRASTCYHIRAVKRFLSDLENGRTPGESVRPVPSNPHTSTDFYAGARRRKRKPVTINGKSESTLRRHARAARPGREYEIMFELLNAYTLYQGGK